MIGEYLTWPVPQCCINEDEHCVCPPMERAVRGWRRKACIPPMTPEQRACCLDEIGRVEGYMRAEHEGLDDAQLASDTLEAWVDYARDKGLL